MGVFSFLKNLFKNNSNIEGLILASSQIKIPNREDYKNNQEMLELIDKYKNNYKDLLYSNKFFSSVDLNSKELFDDVKMYIDIYFNMNLSTNEFIENITIEEKLDYQIKSKKLKLYFNKIIDLEKETRLRLVALIELYTDIKVIMSKNKRNAISNEINNLTNILVAYENYKISIILKLNSYVKNDIYNIIPTEQEKYIN